MPGERKRSEARKEEVHDIALRIIDEEGIHALTMRGISERIGISEAALFRHFKDKEDMISGLAERVFRESIVEESPKGSGVEEQLASLMEAQFSSFQRNPGVTSILFQEEIFREYPAIKERFDSRRKERAKNIASMIQAAKGRGEARKDLDEDTFALIYMGAMRMAVLEWRSSGFAYDLIPQAKRLCGELVRGLLPTTSPRRRGR
jgi:AcrR family transcriptional regulator